MHVPEGASMAHVLWLQFWPLFGLAVAVPLRRGLSLAASFLRS